MYDAKHHKPGEEDDKFNSWFKDIAAKYGGKTVLFSVGPENRIAVMDVALVKQVPLL